MPSTPPSSVYNGLLLIPLARRPDKRCPAELEMSLEWRHVPKECVENDHAGIGSLHSDALGAQFTSREEGK